MSERQPTEHELGIKRGREMYAVRHVVERQFPSKVSAGRDMFLAERAKRQKPTEER